MEVAIAFCRITLLIVATLAFTIQDSQNGNASRDDDNDGYSGDLPFTLPFDSDFADDFDGDDYQSGNEIPFP